MEKSKFYQMARVGETIFTLFIFFKRDKNGREFTQWEIDNKKNVKPFPSFDYIETKGGRKITDHKGGLRKFRTKINEEVLKNNVFGGYVRCEREKIILYNFGSNGVERPEHYAEFKVDSFGSTLTHTYKAKTVSSPAEKPLPQFNNINSPEREKFYKRAELYKQQSEKTRIETIKKISDHFSHLRTKL